MLHPPIWHKFRSLTLTYWQGYGEIKMLIHITNGSLYWHKQTWKTIWRYRINLKLLFPHDPAILCLTIDFRAVVLKVGPWTCSITISWELIRLAKSWAPSPSELLD